MMYWGRYALGMGGEHAVPTMGREFKGGELRGLVLEVIQNTMVCNNDEEL